MSPELQTVLAAALVAGAILYLAREACRFAKRAREQPRGGCERCRLAKRPLADAEEKRKRASPPR